MNLNYLTKFLAKKDKESRFKILCYHGIVERKKHSRIERNFYTCSQFQDHLSSIRRHRVISMSSFLEELTISKSSKKDGIVITFDDGFRNNLLAAEILKKSKIPWTLFVSTKVIDQHGSIWTAELSLLILEGRADYVEIMGRKWSLRETQDREVAFQEIRHSLKQLPSEARRQSLAEIKSQFPEGETERLLDEFPSLKTMLWKDIQSLVSEGVEIGSHGVDHEIHHENQPKEVRERELLESKRELESKLSRPCRFFAYPNGNYCCDSPDEVKRAEYKLAFTTTPGTVTGETDPYLLPRLFPPANRFKFIRQFLWSD